MIPAGAHPLMMARKAGYEIANSLRSNAASTQYLTRTFAAGDRTKWTYSLWVKREKFGIQQPLFYVAGAANDTDYLFIEFDLSDKLSIVTGLTYFRTSTRVFRDPAAHFMVTIAVDTNHATANNRIRVYIDGEEITSWATITNPALGANMGVNQALAHEIGRAEAAYYFDGYAADIRFINGQQIDPTSFGFTDSVSGQWKPKAYAGTYGTTGVFLNFADGSSTTTLGYDVSGNANHWTLTSYTRSAGASDCWCVDTPTNNLCVWDMLYPGDSIKTNGALNAAGTARGTFDAALIASYWEITANAVSVVGGLVSAVGTANTVSVPNGSTYGFRFSGGLLEYTANGSSWTTILSGLTGQQFPYASGGSNTANFGQRAFAYTAPAGYKALSSKNLSGGGTVTVSGTFTGNASADGPRVDINGSPETLTINGNAVTFGTHADRLSNGFKLRTTLATYNVAGSNTWTATVLAPQSKSLFKYQNAKGNP